MKKLLVLLLLLCLVGGFLFILGASKSPSYDFDQTFDGYSEFKDKSVFSSEIKGTSMGPTFSPGDNIYWVKVPISEVKENDIVVFNHPIDVKHKAVAHRVIDITKENSKICLVTKGDNESEPEEESITDRWYRGLVIGVKKDLGTN